MSVLIAEKIEEAPTSSRRQILASLLYRTGLIAGVSMLRSAFVRDLRILAYHRVLSIEDEDAFDFDLELISAAEGEFRQQIRLLKQRYNPVRFRDVIDTIETGRPLPPRPVIVTFDDGYDDNYRIAFPILRELGVPATFFVSTGHIQSGLPFSYDWFVYMMLRTNASHLRITELDIDQRLPRSRQQRRALASDLLDRMKWLSAAAQEGIIDGLEKDWKLPRAQGHVDCCPMTWDQLREMQAAGMEIESHGVWHNMLAKLPLDDMSDEVTGSKLALERELGTSANALSYPVGGTDAYNESVIAAARAAGYKLGCNYVSGTSPIPRESQFELRRLPVERHMDMAWFASLIGVPEAFSYPSRHRTG